MPTQTAAARSYGHPEPEGVARVAQDRMQHVMRHVVAPWCGVPIRLALPQGDRMRIVWQERRGVIEEDYDRGFTFVVDGLGGSWTTFVNWADLWTGHVRAIAPRLQAAVDDARQRLLASIDPVDFWAIRQSRRREE